eukprot:gene1645-1828_t
MATETTVKDMSAYYKSPDLVAKRSQACKWNQAFREIEPCTIQEKAGLFKGTRSAIPQNWNPTGSDPLPSVDLLHELKEICPNACLFTIIPKLDEEETDSASEDENDDVFPRLLCTLYEEPFSNLRGNSLSSYIPSLWIKYHVTQDQIANLEKQTRSQSISNLWYRHREGRITASKVHDVVHMLPSTNPTKLVSRIMGYSNCDLSKVPSVKYGMDNESSARDWYASEMRTLHPNFSCRESGFNVYKAKPFLGASPDGNKLSPGRSSLRKKTLLQMPLTNVVHARKKLMVA